MLLDIQETTRQDKTIGLCWLVLQWKVIRSARDVAHVDYSGHWMLSSLAKLQLQACMLAGLEGNVPPAANSQSSSCHDERIVEDGFAGS